MLPVREEKLLFLLTVAARCYPLLLAYTGRCLLHLTDFDASASLFLSAFHGETPGLDDRCSVAAFLRWDALYFLDIAKTGDYRSDLEYAFLPGLPTIIRALAKLGMVGQFLRLSLISAQFPHCHSLPTQFLC